MLPMATIKEKSPMHEHRANLGKGGANMIELRLRIDRNILVALLLLVLLYLK
jgi:hypothetical protein